MDKYKRGFYQCGEFYLVRDKVGDWIALKDWRDAEWVRHGNKPKTEVYHVHNTLRDLKRICC